MPALCLFPASHAARAGGFAGFPCRRCRMTPAARLAATLAAYEHCAPRYSPSRRIPLMRAEQQAMLATLPDLRGRRVLDLACGTGRYSTLAAQGGATQVVAADFSPAMLARVSHSWRVRADLMH